MSYGHWTDDDPIKRTKLLKKESPWLQRTNPESSLQISQGRPLRLHHDHQVDRAELWMSPVVQRMLLKLIHHICCYVLKK